MQTETQEETDKRVIESIENSSLPLSDEDRYLLKEYYAYEMTEEYWEIENDEQNRTQSK